MFVTLFTQIVLLFNFPFSNVFHSPIFPSQLYKSFTTKKCRRPVAASLAAGGKTFQLSQNAPFITGVSTAANCCCNRKTERVPTSVFFFLYFIFSSSCSLGISGPKPQILFVLLNFIPESGGLVPWSGKGSFPEHCSF